MRPYGIKVSKRDVSLSEVRKSACSGQYHNATRTILFQLTIPEIILKRIATTTARRRDHNRTLALGRPVLGSHLLLIVASGSPRAEILTQLIKTARHVLLQGYRMRPSETSDIYANCSTLMVQRRTVRQRKYSI